ARGEQHLLHEPVAVLLPVVEPHVARASVAAVPAQVGREQTAGVGGLLGGGFGQVFRALRGQLRLVFGGVVDRLALLGDGEVLRLRHRVEFGGRSRLGACRRHCRDCDRRRGSAHSLPHRASAPPPPHRDRRPRGRHRIDRLLPARRSRQTGSRSAYSSIARITCSSGSFSRMRRRTSRSPACSRCESLISRRTAKNTIFISFALSGTLTTPNSSGSPSRAASVSRPSAWMSGWWASSP